MKTKHVSVRIAAFGSILLVAIVTASAASAITVNVSDESTYTSALASLSGDTSGAHTINITASFDITTSSSATNLFYTGSQSLTIEGNGFTIDGTGSRRLLYHDSAATLEINDLTFINGLKTRQGTCGGAVGSAGAVAINRSTFANSQTNTVGGAICVTTGSGADATVTDSTFTGNSSEATGGAISAPGTIIMNNSTVTGNSAGGAGGGLNALDFVLTHTTLVSNSAPAGSNLRGISASNSTLTSFGSVIGLSQGGGANCTNLGGGTTSTGYNFSDDTSCGLTSATDTESGGAPMLDALADNGGPTETRLPLEGSPLIDAIPNADCDAMLTTDQRGLPRPGAAGGSCDIGSVELQAAPLVQAIPALNRVGLAMLAVLLGLGVAILVGRGSAAS